MPTIGVQWVHKRTSVLKVQRPLSTEGRDRSPQKEETALHRRERPFSDHVVIIEWQDLLNKEIAADQRCMV